MTSPAGRRRDRPRHGAGSLGRPCAAYGQPTPTERRDAMNRGLALLGGLSRSAPASCALGIAGLALLAEGLTNAGLEDIARLPRQAANLADSAAEGLGGQGQTAGRPQRARQTAGAGV